jgi:DNA-binding LacI/PurR family transcriptional regulator
MSPVTIRDVAKQANVSIATVSRVLNGSPRVKTETRERVLATIAEMDYRPNLLARRLSIGRALTIGVFLPFLTLPSFVERLRGVQTALTDSEYDLTLFSAETANRIDSLVDNLLRRAGVDGVIIVSIYLTDAHIEQFRQANMPVVLVDIHRPEMNRVVVDDVAGGRTATSHLIELGHREIAFLSDYLENPFGFVAMRHRFMGYQQALEAAGIHFNTEYHQQGGLGGREAFQKAKALLTLPHRPTAIFAASDTYAVGVLKAAHELAIKVPEELSVIGYDDIRDAEYLHLTTIRQHLMDMGIEGAHLLLDVLEDPMGEPREICLPTELIVRGTTAPPLH